jgi:hypothetical protein
MYMILFVTHYSATPLDLQGLHGFDIYLFNTLIMYRFLGTLFQLISHILVLCYMISLCMYFGIQLFVQSFMKCERLAANILNIHM